MYDQRFDPLGCCTLGVLAPLECRGGSHSAPLLLFVVLAALLAPGTQLVHLDECSLAWGWMSDASLIDLSSTRSPSWALPTPSFRCSWKTLQQTNKPNTLKDYVRVSENQVSCPRVSSPCGAWLPLTKIILVGDKTPQNHSCGRWCTTKPFLQGSCTTTNAFLWRKEGKHEMQMRMQKREIFFFFFFLWTWRETRTKRAEEGRTRSKTSRTRARGVPWAPCAPAFIEGRHPLVGRPRWLAGHVAGPIFVPSFQRFLITTPHFKNTWIHGGVGRCRPRSGPIWTWTWKSTKFMHALDSKFLWQPFSSNFAPWALV